MNPADDIILHHYPGSPYAEKIRLILGYTSLAWSSVEIPVTPPRPSLEPILGSFRRTPVLQLGADFFCDTRLIAAVLDALGGQRRMAARGNRALAAAICGWVEPRAFVLTGPLRFQAVEDVDGVFEGTVDAATFGADRVPFMRPAIDAMQFASLQGSAADHVRAYLEIVETTLAEQAPFIGGVEPCIADFSAYHLVWWLRRPPARVELLDALTHVPRWADRMAAFGHGTYAAIEPREALTRARSAQQRPAWMSPWPSRPGRLGERIAIVPDDYGRDPIVGRVVDSTSNHVAIERDVSIGVVRVHFPRLGYEITPAPLEAATR